eukprot:COSAG01_NODE_924_length_12710_cov_10.895567_6_plen_87_part_00
MGELAGVVGASAGADTWHLLAADMGVGVGRRSGGAERGGPAHARCAAACSHGQPAAIRLEFPPLCVACVVVVAVIYWRRPTHAAAR